MKKINIAISGVGNCASALIQGLYYYKNRSPVGIMFENIGGYTIGDIEIVAAFDVARNKVGKDISEAIFQEPNNTLRFQDVPVTGVIVKRGKTLDGLGDKLRDLVVECDETPADIVKILKEKNTHVLINYMPVGSDNAAQYYAKAAIDAGCGFINAMPSFIVSDEVWLNKFKTAGLPCIGDDVKSQIGATILHRALITLLIERGAKISNTYQLNYGGNSDFYNMQEECRLKNKLISKKEAVLCLLSNKGIDNDTYIGPAGYIPWLKDGKNAEIKVEGNIFGNAPIEIEVKLKVIDSPNSAGVVVDAIRCIKLAIDRNESGALEWPSSYYMKHPPVQYNDTTALQGLKEWVG